MSTVLFPLGPYHPAFAEPFSIVLRTRGETVVAVEDTQTGFCHRDVLACAEGQSFEDALVIFERSCSFAGHAHRLALTQAIEDAQGLSIQQPAALLRTSFAEIEQMLARLWVLSRTAQALGQFGLAREALDQREALMTACEASTGQRIYWGVAVPGGAREDIDVAPVAEVLAKLAPAVQAWQTAVAPTSRLGRAGVGVASIPAEVATRLRLEGLAAAALGPETDERRLHPTEGYALVDVSWPDGEQTAGDLASRLRALADDLGMSHSIAVAALDALGTRKVGSPAALHKLKAPVPGRARVEGPHGPVEVSLVLQPTDTVTDLLLQTPTTRTLSALSLALEGARLALVPAILASLDLCPECIDL